MWFVTMMWFFILVFCFFVQIRLIRSVLHLIFEWANTNAVLHDLMDDEDHDTLLHFDEIDVVAHDLLDRTITTRYQRIFNTGDIEFYLNDILGDFGSEIPRDLQILKDRDYASYKFVNDRENLHDSFIQKGLSEKYKLMLTDGTKNTEAKLKELLRAFPKQNSVINRIANSRNKLTMYNNRTQLEILYDVYNNGSDNVKAHLGQILSEIQSEGLKCSMGNISRIVQASYVENPEQIPITQAMVTQQMLMRAGIISKELESQGNVDPKLISKQITETLVAEYGKQYGEKQITEMVKGWNL